MVDENTRDAEALRILEAAHGLDEETLAAEPPRPRPLDADALARVRDAVDQSFDRAWRALRARADAAPSPARRSFATWTREALLERLAALRTLLGPELQLAHRHLEQLTEDDLRSLLADVEELAARHGGGAT